MILVLVNVGVFEDVTVSAFFLSFVLSPMAATDVVELDAVSSVSSVTSANVSKSSVSDAIVLFR